MNVNTIEHRQAVLNIIADDRLFDTLEKGYPLAIIKGETIAGKQTARKVLVLNSFDGLTEVMFLDDSQKDVFPNEWIEYL